MLARRVHENGGYSGKGEDSVWAQQVGFLLNKADLANATAECLG